MWLLGSFMLSLLAAPVFGEQGDDIPRGAILRKRHTCPTDTKCTTCCSPQMNYRLPTDSIGMTSYAECLVWQVQQQASHFVITPNEDSTLDPSFMNTEGLGKVRSASFGWNPGVRLGMSYTAERDFWQALAQYTRFTTDGSRTHSLTLVTTPTEFLMPTFYVPPDTVVSAKNVVTFSYQMGDLLARRSFLPTEQIKLSFSIGGTGGYIKEQSKITYDSTNPTHVKNSWSFGGGGFRAGLDSNWHMGSGFGLFGRISFAAILGHYTNSQRISTDGLPGSIGNVPLPISNHLAHTSYAGILLMPTTQIALGFDWCRTFCNCAIRGINIALATEFNNLANLQQVFKVVRGPSTPAESQSPMLRDVSSVYMYGANFRVGVDY